MTAYGATGTVVSVGSADPAEPELSALDPFASPPGRPPTSAVFLWAFAAIGLMLCAWTLATPIGAAPDEPDHIIASAALLRGQFDEPVHYRPGGDIASVRVPAWAEGVVLDANCFAHLPQVSASCSGPLTRSTKIVSANTQFSNAPPLYYMIVGVPSLVLNGPSAVYAMRLVGDLLNAALVALGLTLLVRFYPRRTPLVGALIALTPMTVFLMSVVNSSGLEISAAFATWCGAICVAEYPALPRALAAWTGISAAILALSRPTSPIDVAIVALTTMVLIGWRDLHRHWTFNLRWLLTPVLVAGGVAAVVLLVAGTPSPVIAPLPHPVSLASNAWAALKQSRFVFRDTIGNFGWLDTPVSSPVVVAWVACLAIVTVSACVMSRACRRTLAVLGLLIVATMLVIETPRINDLGLWWQGRYSLPVLIGFALVATTFTWPERARRAGRHRRPRAERTNVDTIVACVLGLVLSVAQVSAFELALRRYQTGLTDRPHPRVSWLPPGGHPFVTILFGAGIIAMVTFAVFMTRVTPVTLDGSSWHPPAPPQGR